MTADLSRFGEVNIQPIFSSNKYIPVLILQQGSHMCICNGSFTRFPSNEVGELLLLQIEMGESVYRPNPDQAISSFNNGESFVIESTPCFEIAPERIYLACPAISF